VAVSLNRVLDRDGAREALGVSLALALSLLAAIPLWAGEGMVYTRAGGDSPFLLQRVYEMAQALADGPLPVRWMPSANLGLGYPAYNYYAALPYYLAAVLHLAGLGIIASIQVTQALGFALGGLAAYGLARALGLRRPAAVAAVGFFTFAPFHLVNVYVRGDSLSEFWAMGLVMACLWAVALLRRRPDAGRALLLAAAYAALVLAHNITALLASPLIGLVLLASLWRRERRAALALYAVGALVLGLALSAWFWAPALAERGLVQLAEQTTGYFDFRGHFRGANLVQPSLAFDYGVGADGGAFRMGLVQALLVALSLLAVAVRWRRVQSRPIWCAYGLGVVASTLLITPLTTVLWERLPLLAYAQFPWRLLGVQAALAAPLVGLLADLQPGRRTRLLLAAALVTAMGVASLIDLHPDRLPLTEGDVTAERLWLFEGYSGNIGGTVRAEYLPAALVPRYYTSPQLLAREAFVGPWPLGGAAMAAEPLAHHAAAQTWRVILEAPERLVFPVAAFEGWGATIDGALAEIVALPGLGLIGLDVQAGEHVITLSLGRTPVRRAAEIATLTGVGVWLAIGVWWATRRRRRAVMSMAAGVLLGAAGAWALGRPLPGPVADQHIGPLVMDMGSYPYLHHEPDGLRIGSTTLLEYAYNADTLTPGDDLAIDLAWLRPAPGEIVQLRLMGLSSHLHDQSVEWVEELSAIDATQTRVTLRLPDDLPPGVYVPRVGIKRGGESLAIENVRGTLQSRTCLKPIWVLPRAASPEMAAPLAEYGDPHALPTLTLVQAATERIKGHGLELALQWRVRQTPRQNYAISVRYLHADGSTVESLDLAPLSPDYPTGLWRQGEAVTTRLRVVVGRDEVEPGDRWEIVLYDRVTLASIGAGLVPVELD
jgi:hypothetical protein